MPGNRRGKCRIEYFAMKEEINQLSAKGWMWRHIYDLLVSKEKITMSYCTFLRYVHAKPTPRSNANPAPTPRTHAKEFSHNKIIDDESSLI
jgi:hypothetical protein